MLPLLEDLKGGLILFSAVAFFLNKKRHIVAVFFTGLVLLKLKSDSNSNLKCYGKYFF